MNQTLEKVNNIFEELIRKFKFTNLDENGKVYYMNGNDGTEFDYYVNDRLCEFMCFYDKNKMGAIKINIL